jgi:hypothetical protein
MAGGGVNAGPPSSGGTGSGVAAPTGVDACGAPLVPGDVAVSGEAGPGLALGPDGTAAGEPGPAGGLGGTSDVLHPAATVTTRVAAMRASRDARGRGRPALIGADVSLPDRQPPPGRLSADGEHEPGGEDRDDPDMEHEVGHAGRPDRDDERL